MLMFTGLVLLCLLGIRLGFSYPYNSLAHRLISYFEKKESAWVFVTVDLLIIITGCLVGGIAYTIDSLFPFIRAPDLTWKIQPALVIGSLVIAGGFELYRFYIRKSPVNILSLIILMITGCCLAAFIADGKTFSSSGIFGLCCGLAFSTGALFSETMLKMVSFENNPENTLYFMVTAERRTSVLIGYIYLGLAAVRFAFRL